MLLNFAICISSHATSHLLLSFFSSFFCYFTSLPLGTGDSIRARTVLTCFTLPLLFFLSNHILFGSLKRNILVKSYFKNIFCRSIKTHWFFSREILLLRLQRDVLLPSGKLKSIKLFEIHPKSIPKRLWHMRTAKNTVWLALGADNFIIYHLHI